MAFLSVSLSRQRMRLVTEAGGSREYVISSSAWGIGTEPGSNRTPTGQFCVCEKIGAGLSPCTVFKNRIPSGEWDPEGVDVEDDLILSRILWLEGLDAENANTRARYIYIHGTNHEAELGAPASHGCIRLSREDMVEVFELVEVGDRVEISSE